MFVTPGLKRKREDAAFSSFDKQVAQYQSGDIKRGGVTLKARDGHEVRVHEVVVIGNSKTIEDLLDESDGDTVPLPIDGNELQMCVDFMYGEEPSLSDFEKVASLAQVADYLEMEALCQPLVAAMTASVEQVEIGQLVGLCERWPHHEKFHAVVFQSLRDRFVEFVSHATWSTAPKEFVQKLLGDNGLRVESESVVYEALITWLRAQAAAVGPEVKAKLLALVRMTPLQGLKDALPEAALVARPPTAPEDEKAWIKLLFDTALVGTQWEHREMHPLRAALVERLDGLHVPEGVYGTVESWKQQHTAKVPPLVVVARREPLFDNLPCLRVVRDRALAAQAPAERYPKDGKKLYIVGGWGGSERLSSVECYDPSTGAFEEVAEIETARSGMGVAVLEGKLYAVGGFTGTENLSSVERYDPATGEWEAVADMGSLRPGFKVAVLAGKLYAVGGSRPDGTRLRSVVRYDPSTNAWEAVADMGSARSSHGVAVLEGKLYAVGGYNGTDFLSSVERYDPATNAWEVVTPMGMPRIRMGVAAIEGKLYAVGGKGSEHQVERYDPVTNAWEVVNPMVTGRTDFAVAACQGNLYAAGGVGTGVAGRLSSVERYDPTTNAWEQVGEMGTKRSSFGLAAL